MPAITNDNYRVIFRTINLYSNKVTDISLIQHNDTIFVFEIFGRDRMPFTIEDVILNAVRSDNALIVQETGITVDTASDGGVRNVLTIVLDPRIVDISGDVTFELVFIDNGVTISTYKFGARVSAMLVNGQSTAPPASEIMDKLYISSRNPEIDSVTGNWKIFDNVTGQMIVTDYPSQPEANKVDTVFDSNSGKAIANKTVTAKFINVDRAIADSVSDINNIETDITELRNDTDSNTSAISAIETDINDIGDDMVALDGRVTALEQSGGGGGGGGADYTKVANALITATEMAESLTIQPNPNDTSFHGLTISPPTGGVGNTTPVINPTVTVGGKNWFNKNKPFGRADHATVAPNNTGVTLTSKVSGSYRVVYMTMEHNTMLGKQYTLKANWTASGNAIGRVAFYFVSDAYTTVGGVIGDITTSGGSSTFTIPSVLPVGATQLCMMFYVNTNGTLAVGDTMAYTNVQLELGDTATAYEPYTTPQSVTLNGITLDDGDSINVVNGVVTSKIGGITTNITETSNGQALLNLHGYTATAGGNNATVIQMSGGGMVSVTYNRSIVAEIAEIKAVLTALLGG